jgi:hypothetical protein
MRKFILLFLFINFYIVAYNQVIKGTILDKKTKSPIYFASVYFNGTFVGTHSDQNGYFDPLGISWEGEMARQRIADWLPYEYSIKE